MHITLRLVSNEGECRSVYMGVGVGGGSGWERKASIHIIVSVLWFLIAGSVLSLPMQFSFEKMTRYVKVQNKRKK